MAEYIKPEKDRYIKLSKALEVLDSCACWWAHDRMECIPAVDAVEVVRCRKCKCYPKDFDEDSWNWCFGIGNATKPNDFCSYGKRREDGET